MAGAAITSLANPLTFIASGAAVAFWFFFATEKELSPRGYEREEIIRCYPDFQMKHLMQIQKMKPIFEDELIQLYIFRTIPYLNTT